MLPFPFFLLFWINNFILVLKIRHIRKPDIICEEWPSNKCIYVGDLVICIWVIMAEGHDTSPSKQAEHMVARQYRPKREKRKRRKKMIQWFRRFSDHVSAPNWMGPAMWTISSLSSTMSKEFYQYKTINVDNCNATANTSKNSIA